MTLAQRITEWNKTRGLLEQGYDAERESAFILEELHELLGFKGDVKGYARYLAHKIVFSKIAVFERNGTWEALDKTEPTDQDILDGLGDLIVFAVGAMAKKLHEMRSKLTPDDILSQIMDTNDKKGSKTDEKGKVVKPDSFEQPKLA